MKWGCTYSDNMSYVVKLQTQDVSSSVHVSDEEPRLDLIDPGPGSGDDTGGAGGRHRVENIRRVPQMRLRMSETGVFKL